MGLSISTLFLISLILKVIIGIVLPLAPDEAYYWVWSHHLQLSYYDHPAFVSWLALLGHPFEEFLSAVRLPTMIMSHLTLGLWLVLLKGVMSEQQRFWFLALALALPFTGIGGVFMTPDVPLLFFWTLTLVLTKHLIHSGKSRDALAAGLALGLGFTSKYNSVLILPILLFWLYTQVPIKKKLLIYLFLGFAGACITSFPVWYWNLTNDLTSFGFQLGHGFSGKFKISHPIDYVLAQIGLLFPPTVYFAYQGLKKAPPWLVLCAAWPFLFFGISSFFAYAEANWPLVGHPAAVALAVIGTPKLPAKWLKVTISIFILLTSLVAAEVFFGWIPKGDKRIKTDIFKKYLAAAEAVEGRAPVFARTYQMASFISFENKTRVYKLRGMNRVDVFDFLPQSEPTGQQFFLIVKINEALPERYLDFYEIVSRENIDKKFELAKVKRK